jgi:hypothetical protein
VPDAVEFESCTAYNGGTVALKRRVHLLVLAVVVSMATFGTLAGQAWAGGAGTAAQDQYSPPPVVTPAHHHQQMKPPSHGTAPTGSPGSTLPFTGLSLLKVVLIGVALLLLGILLRRSVPRRGP